MQVAATRGKDMQVITRVAQHLMHPAAVKVFQGLTELLTHPISARSFLTGRNLVVLMDVIMRQPFEPLNRVVKACRSHAPGANRCAGEMNRMRGLRQPVTEEKAIKRPEDEAFRPAGRAGNDIPGLQAVLFNVPQRAGSGINS